MNDWSKIGWGIADAKQRRITELEIEVAGYKHVSDHVRQLTGDYESVDIDFTVGRLLRERQVSLQRAEEAERRLREVEAERDVHKRRAEAFREELNRHFPHMQGRIKALEAGTWESKAESLATENEMLRAGARASYQDLKTAYDELEALRGLVAETVRLLKLYGLPFTSDAWRDWKRLVDDLQSQLATLREEKERLQAELDDLGISYDSLTQTAGEYQTEWERLRELLAEAVPTVQRALAEVEHHGVEKEIETTRTLLSRIQDELRPKGA